MSKVLRKSLVEEGSSSSEEDVAGEMTWKPPAFDHNSKAMALKHSLVSRKKRIHSASFSHSGVNGITVDGLASDVRSIAAALGRTRVSTSRVPFGKNSRKSRDGRRIPSKRGGKNHENPTDVLDEIVLDHDDPDYDSDANDPILIEDVAPAPTDEEFERAFLSLQREFFIHGKTQEVVDSMMEMNLAAHHRRRIPYLAIMTALQHKQTQFELTSELLSDMYGKIINQAHVQQGFLLVLNELGDLLIDFPKVIEPLARFVARALIDEILPPKFLEFQKLAFSQSPGPIPHKCELHFEEIGLSPLASTPPLLSDATRNLPIVNKSVPNNATRVAQRNLSESNGGGTSYLSSSNIVDDTITTASSGIGSASSLSNSSTAQSELVMQVLLRAESLLTLSHTFARLDNIWGVYFGPNSTALLVRRICGLLNAYMDSGDVEEITEGLREMDSPHFHHELVYQAIILAVEKSTDKARARILQLLSELCRSVVITTNQLTLGMRRVYAELPDLQVDVPAAYALTERFIKEAVCDGFVSKALASELPAIPRKRFVSETDSINRRDPIIPL